MLTRLDDEMLSETELARARDVLLEGASNRELRGPEYRDSDTDLWGDPIDHVHAWFPPRWVVALTWRLWSEQWGHDLVGHVLAGDRYEEPSARILAQAPTLELTHREHTGLTQLVLASIDQGYTASRLDWLVWRLDSPHLREQLEERRHSADRPIAERAWGTLNDLLGPDFNPWPDEWRTDP